MCEHNCGIDQPLEEIKTHFLINNMEDSECFNESSDNPKYCVKPYKDITINFWKVMMIRIINKNYIQQFCRYKWYKNIINDEYCPRVKFLKVTNY